LMTNVKFDPRHVLKTQWDMYQPDWSLAGTDQANAAYDFSLDNINMLTDADARDPANNCNTDEITKDPASASADNIPH